MNRRVWITASALPATARGLPAARVIALDGAGAAAASAAPAHHLPQTRHGGTGGDCFTPARERPRIPDCGGQGLRGLHSDLNERVGAAVRKEQVDNVMA